jgi:hypothetical protein
MSIDASRIMAARHAILEAAQEMLTGELSYIEGARKIKQAWFSSRLDESDPDFLAFVGIDSETDALPFGEMRAHWQAAALKALQPELDRMEDWARNFGEPHCRSLVDRFLTRQIQIDPFLDAS